MPSSKTSRSWLRTTLTTGLVASALLVGANAQANTNAVQTAKSKPKILVLGAGISGVMAANTLYEKGFTDVTIIEANDYIGGRMKQGSFAGRKIELGANWIHGTIENPIYDLAKKSGLQTIETNWSSVSILPFDPNEEEEVEQFEAAFEKMEERAARYLNRGKKDLSVNAAMRYEGWVPHTPLENALLYNEMDLEMGPADKTSFELALNTPTYAKDDKDAFVIDQKGYGTLAYSLLDKSFPNPLANKNIVLNNKVTKIQYTDKGVTVSATNVKTGAASTYKGDFVVTTFSAGVLKAKSRELFKPALPEDKLDAIHRVDMTLFLKVFVETTERFWADYTNDAETWVYADKVTGNFTSWVDLSLPKLGKAFAQPKNASYVALCMLGSDFAARVETISDAELKSEVIHVMRAMFPKAAGRINEKTVPSVVMQKWGQDELFLGSWSNPRPDFTKADFAKLGEPVGRVYFSGEHTSAEYFGYVHGAYRAGIATAQQLLKRSEFK